MADVARKACYPGSVTTLADMVTLAGGASVTIRNIHATEPLYIGGDANVTASTGLIIAAGKQFSCVIDPSEEIYGISGTSTVTVTAAIFRTNTYNPTSLG